MDPHLRGQGKAGGTELVGGSRPGGALDPGELVGCIRDLNSCPQAQMIEIEELGVGGR